MHGLVFYNLSIKAQSRLQADFKGRHPFEKENFLCMLYDVFFEFAVGKKWVDMTWSSSKFKNKFSHGKDLFTSSLIGRF